MIVIQRNSEGKLEFVHDIPGVGTFLKDTAQTLQDEDELIERARRWAINCGFRFVNKDKEDKV